MLFNQKFDLVISLGEDCACSSYMRRNRLQDYSYPFDWLAQATFKTRVNTIVNDFKDFLRKDALVEIADTEQSKKYTTKSYVDNVLNFAFYHDFDRNLSFEESYPRVREKYERRIKRMYSNIKESEYILFIWWSRDKHQDLGLIHECYSNLKEKFINQKIYLLIIEFAEEEQEIYLEDNHVLILRYDNISYKHNPAWTKTMGNKANNQKAFSQIKMNRTFSWRMRYLQYILVKILIEIFPVKKMRIEMRRNWKYKFYRDKL